MSCKQCVFFSRANADGKYSFEQREGSCTRYPEHIIVNSDHFCGEIILKLNIAANEKIESPVTVTHPEKFKELYDQLNIQYTKIYDLTQKNKALRQLYKKKTGKIAVIRTKNEGEA